MNIRLSSLMAVLIFGGSLVASAQGYDDDDIYFNPDKAKTQPKAKVKTSGNTTVYDFPAADTYQPVATITGTNIDIDTYNRRGVFAKVDTTRRQQQQQNSGDFNYTQKIERFYNPDVITQSNDSELAELYYSQPQTSVNIYVQNDPFAYNYWGWSNPYYPSWYWNSPYFSWTFGWGGPSWSWNWGWGPSWSWGWGPSWSWGPSWGWSVPARPNRPHGNIRYAGGSRPSGNYRDGYRTGSRPSHSTGTSNYRPGGRSSGYRNSNRSSIRNGSGNNRSNSNSGSYRYNNNNGNSNYRQDSGNSGYRSSGSFGSGGGFRGGSGSFGGGSRGGGGGRGRH